MRVEPGQDGGQPCQPLQRQRLSQWPAMHAQEETTVGIADIHNFRQAAPDLATSGQPNEDQLAAIAAAGYDVLVNLALHDDPRYSLRDEASSVRALGMEYVHIPVQFAAPASSDLVL
ncbi:MAG: sulfur transferase domain-containing protein, partial [Betaproteobacteria bacterium]